MMLQILFVFLWTCGSALEVVLHDYALYKSTFTLLYFTLLYFATRKYDDMLSRFDTIPERDRRTKFLYNYRASALLC